MLEWWSESGEEKVLGRALGRKVGPSPTGWDIGVRSITLSSHACPSSLDLPTKLSIIQCHRDEVQELPTKADIIAKSDMTGIEMFKYDDHIMGIQGHPEYSKDLLLHLIDRLIQKNFIMEAIDVGARERAVMLEPDTNAWKRLCISFLKSSICTRWGSDPLSYGSYSHVSVHSSGQDYDILAENVGNRLFFAGEATCRQYPTTMHGAFMSGLREASRIYQLTHVQQATMHGACIVSSTGT
ncbi:gamma-glutamyl peptidase [Trifolium repens]|nr:gamma-glutamyl peptidase [Trifolium repens]